MPTTTIQAVSPGYVYTVTASSEAIVRDVETDKLLCKANNGKQGMFVAIGGTVSMATDDPTATITQSNTTSGGARFEVHQTRPDTGEEGIIYLIPITSGTDENNEYEEWIWVKGEWERLGTTGVNLSNYATLTDANTYSGNNTFNGLLLKSNSASLGDTSVLNRSEADARYGRLAEGNTWYNEQHIAAGGTLTLHPSATLITNNIQGDVLGNGRLNFNGLHLTHVGDIAASGINVNRAYTIHLHVATINATAGDSIRMQSPVDVDGSLRMHGRLLVDTIQPNNHTYIDIDAATINNLGVSGSISITGDLRMHSNSTLVVGKITSPSESIAINSDLVFVDCGIDNADYLRVNNGVETDILTTNVIETLNRSATIVIKDTIELQAGYSSGIRFSGIRSLTNGEVALTLDSTKNCITAGNVNVPLVAPALSGVLSLKTGDVVVAYNAPTTTVHSVNSMLVQASEGIKVTSNLYSAPDVTISPSIIEAFQLNEDLFGVHKYGLRITPESCQLFGIDFAYSDVWSSYPVDNEPPLFSPLDTVKIMKPSLSVASTDIAAVDFDYANKVLFRTFPNDGGIAIFEFQAGYWSDDSHSAITTSGMVDLRKPSLSVTALNENSLINKTELLYIVPIVTDKNMNKLAIGHDAALGGASSVYITPRSYNNEIVGVESVVIGVNADSADRGVAIGRNADAASAGISIGCNSTANDNSVVIGGDASASIDATALGYGAWAANGGVAIGHKCYAAVGGLNLSTGGGNDIYGARFSMLWYGGTSYDDRDNSGYLSFEIGNNFYSDRALTGAQNDTVTISKPNLWSALDRAKYRGAQPYTSYAESAVSNIPALEPNSITHIYTATNAAIDLSGITLAQHDAAVTTAELWVEVTSAGATITWPEGIIWPDEADPTVAPSFSGPEESTEVGYITQRLYCVTLRTQRRRNLSDGTSSSVLIASIAYAVDSKLPDTAGGSD